MADRVGLHAFVTIATIIMTLKERLTGRDIYGRINGVILDLFLFPKRKLMRCA